MKLENENKKIMVVMDFDYTFTKHHTKGSKKQFDYETPYEANLRSKDALKTLMMKFYKDPNIVLAIATNGKHTKRIKETLTYFGLDAESVLIQAFNANATTVRISDAFGYIAKKPLGKNKHIVYLLKAYYEQDSNVVAISKIILFDDDNKNIVALNDYARYVEQYHPFLKKKLSIPVLGLRVPRPELLTAKKYDAELDCEVFQETAISKSAYKKALETLKNTIYFDQSALKENINIVNAQPKKLNLAEFVKKDVKRKNIGAQKKLLTKYFNKKTKFNIKEDDLSDDEELSSTESSDSSRENSNNK